MSYHSPRELKIYNNDYFIYSTSVPERFITVKINVSLENGTNLIRFYIPEGCSKPSDIKDTDDNRYLSLAFQNINFESEPIN